MENKEIILKKLAEAKNLKSQKLYFTVQENSIPPLASYLSVPRLIVVISGSKQVLLPLKNGRIELSLKAGDMLYCPPYTWEKHNWSGNYEMLCIVARRDYLRVSLYKHESFNNYKQPEAIFHHTGLPYNETLRSTISAMNSAGGIRDMNVVHSLAAALIGLAEYECRRTMQDISGRPELLFNQIRNWVAHSFQEDISRQLAAKVFNISSSYISQLFKIYCDRTFKDYLIHCRMDYAQELLERTDLLVYQVAAQAGFQNYVHFVRRFRELNGISPGKYRDAYYSNQ